MHIDGYDITLDAATKFYNSLRIFGWFHHPTDRLKKIKFSGQKVLSSISEVAIPHGGVLNLGPDKGFTLQLMRREEALPDDAALTFITQRGWKRTIRLLDLTHDRAKTYRGPAVMDEFFATVDAIPNAQVLDIGGRDRSGIDWQENFRQARVSRHIDKTGNRGGRQYAQDDDDDD